jgi:ATP-dependent helicase HrpA
MDIRKLPFFHPPKVDEVNRGCAELLELGCFNEARQTSGLGYRVARLAMLEPRLACMVIEGNDLGIREDVATMAAILEAGGIASRGNQRWRSLVTESRSDLIAQLELWGKVTPLLNRLSNEELEKMGVDVKNLLKAREVRGKLLRELSSEKEGKLISSRREAQELAILAGFKGLVFVRKGAGWTQGDDQIRILSSESVVSRKAKFILGIPWDLDVRDAQPGEHTLALIRMATELGVEFVPEPLKKLVRKHGKRRKRSGQGEFFRVHSQREQPRGRGR